MLAVLIGTVSWAAEGVAFFLVLVALGVPPTTTLLIQAVFILSTATILGGLSMMPGGLAVAELSIAGMLDEDRRDVRSDSRRGDDHHPLRDALVRRGDRAVALGFATRRLQASPQVTKSRGRCASAHSHRMPRGR